MGSKLFNQKVAFFFATILITFTIESCSRNVSQEIDYSKNKKFNVIYQKDGYTILRDTAYADKENFNEKFNSREIVDDLAARIVKYHENYRITSTPRKFTHPVAIDFEISNLIAIIERLQKIEGAEYSSEKAGFRIYLGAYDQEAAETYESSRQNPLLKGPSVYKDYLTTLVIGTYNYSEKTPAYNLGNLCPPNCPPPQNKYPLIPDQSIMRIYRKALLRTDVK